MLYKVDADTTNVIFSKYGRDFEILDVSDCFTDLMVLRARAIFVDPDELYDQEIDFLVDVFDGESDKEVYFTSQPAYPELLKNVKWTLFQDTQNRGANTTMTVKKYSNDDIVKMLEDVEGIGSRFYANGILNYGGRSRNGNYYT